MKRVRWGVIGAGGIAHRRTLPVFLQVANSTLVSVMDVEGAEELGKRYGVGSTDRIEAVLARDEVDAVYIATPVQFHAEQVIAAARARKHVLCEKPLARNLSEARTMVDACIRAGVLLQDAYMLRHHRAHGEVLRLLREGAIGKPFYAHAEWSFSYEPIEGAWRQIPELGGGGALMDVGSHMVDIVEMFLGRIARVACRIGTFVHSYPVEDVGTVLLEFESGVHGTLVASFAASGDIMPTRLHLYGSTGAIHAHGTMGQGSGGEVAIYRERDGRGSQETVPYQEVNTYARQVESMARRVLAGERLDARSAEGMLCTVAVLDACYESARTGRFVEIRV
jgi:predicted dehydrogenase